jgi:general secretion pathway protein G
VIRANLYLLRSCIDQHLADKGYHPESLQTLVDERYLKYVPVDPFSGTAEGAWEELDAKSSEIEELKGGCRSSKQVTDVRYADDTRVSFDGTQIHEW